MEIVHFLIAADRVHIGYKSFANVEAVALERKALPFCQRMNDLRVGADVGNVERNGALITVEVIIEAGGLFHEKRRADAAQVQCVAEVGFEIAFDEFDCPLHFVSVQRRFVRIRNTNLAHDNPSFSIVFW